MDWNATGRDDEAMGNLGEGREIDGVGWETARNEWGLKETLNCLEGMGEDYSPKQ